MHHIDRFTPAVAAPIIGPRLKKQLLERLRAPQIALSEDACAARQDLAGPGR
jgi:aryl-alcohol dehydrogenase-like predicted oxidoreductase